MIAQVCSVRFLLTSLCLLCFVVLALSKVQAQEKQESFYAQVTRSVVRLVHYDATIQTHGRDNVPLTNIRRQSDGTGFFIHTPNSLFIVTAAHSLAGRDYDLLALVPLKPEGEQQAKVWELRLPRSEWVFHPSKATERTHAVDVAAMKIPSHKNLGAIVFKYCLGDCPKEQHNQLANDDIEPPAQVVIFGYPQDTAITLREPRPVGQNGIVALKTNEEFLIIDGKYIESRAFLIEANIDKGSSGSPVIKTPIVGQLSLAGVLSARIPGQPYAVVTPVSCIREVLDLTKDKAIGKQGWVLPDQ
jgi:hypothetical protein